MYGMDFHLFLLIHSLVQSLYKEKNDAQRNEEVQSPSFTGHGSATQLFDLQSDALSKKQEER
jgi:hypothetical protein